MKRNGFPLHLMNIYKLEQDKEYNAGCASLGRYCGSMFVSSLVETLTRDPSTKRTLRGRTVMRYVPGFCLGKSE
jgi:hypothetical protein